MSDAQPESVIGRCEVCGGITPAGHRICDYCWPQAALASGRAVRCAQCGKPRLVEKLVRLPNAALVCAAHLEIVNEPDLQSN